MIKKFFTVNRVLWLVFLALLAVLLPHTAWAFSMFESMESRWVSYPAAFAVEAAIAALIYKLSKHIEQAPKKKNIWAKFAARYLNAYSVALVFAIGISSLANLAHAVEFGQDMAIFAEWGLPSEIYSLAFGAILPAVSLVFALVLSNVTETEHEEDPAVAEAKVTITELRRELRDTKGQLTLAVQRYDAMGDVFVRLMSEEKREKILAASQLWPQLPGSAIAIIAESSPSYVSEVLAVVK